MGYLGNLSEDSLRRIKNIENGFRNYPAYSTYQIRNFIYDFRAGIHALEVTRNGEPVNLFLFLPGDEGKIGNIALYGSNLQGHYNAMRSSMMAFGMRISEISYDHGNETFLDIYLDY